MSERTCSTDGCFHPVKARGYCQPCYYAQRRQGRWSTGTCGFDGCDKPLYAKRLCRRCYSRYWSKGTAEFSRHERGGAYLWFVEHVIIETDACIPSPHLAGGYGSMCLHGKTLKMHRVACEMEHGPPPEGKPWATHQCPGGGNPACINRRHLKWGDAQSNYDDMVRDGRRKIAYGTGRSSAKLSDADCGEMKLMVAAGATRRQVADQYGVNASTVTRIVNGKRRTRQSTPSD